MLFFSAYFGSVQILHCLITSACFAVLCVFALSIVYCSFNTRYSAQRRKGPQSTRRADHTRLFPGHGNHREPKRERDPAKHPGFES